LLVQISVAARIPEQELSATIEVFSCWSWIGAPQPPGDGQVWPHPMIRVKVPTGPEFAAITTGW
jgi:hypothetical protein